MVAILTIIDKFKFIQRFMSSSIINGMKFSWSKSDILVKMFMPRYLILPKRMERGGLCAAVFQSSTYMGKIVNFVQFIAESKSLEN